MRDFCLLQKKDEKYFLNEQNNDSPFAYHLFIKKIIQEAIDKNSIERYHFMLFRNLLEKTASFLGYNSWGELIVVNGMSEEERKSYIRFINLSSHSKISDLESKELKSNEKNLLNLLFENLKKNTNGRSNLNVRSKDTIYYIYNSRND